MSDAEGLLAELGLPTGDLYDLPVSNRRFPDGAEYRIEIPSVEGPAAMRKVLEAAEQLGVRVHRVSQGSGIMLLTDREIQEMAELGREAQVEVSLFIGPRAPWEGTGQALTPDGKLLGWRHTGMDQLVYAYRDVERAVELGIRSVLIADEGLLWLVAEGRRRGRLPADLILKGSALLGAANPLQVRMLEQLGLDTINVASDISLPRLAAMRRVISIPIDLYIEAPDGLGGFTRYHELGRLVTIAAPIYLKFGLRNAPGIYPSGAHLQGVAEATGKERVRRAAIGLEHLRREYPTATVSSPGAAGLGVPATSTTDRLTAGS